MAGGDPIGANTGRNPAPSVVVEAPGVQPTLAQDCGVATGISAGILAGGGPVVPDQVLGLPLGDLVDTLPMDFEAIATSQAQQEFAQLSAEVRSQGEG